MTRAQLRQLLAPLPCGHKPQGEGDVGKPRCSSCSKKPELQLQRLPTLAEMRSVLETCLPCGHPPKNYLNADKAMCELCYHKEQLSLLAVQEEQFGVVTTIVGTEKQVAWARAIRVSKLQRIEERRREGTFTPKLFGLLEKLHSTTDALWFIRIRGLPLKAKSPGKRAFSKALGQQELAAEPTTTEEEWEA